MLQARLNCPQPTPVNGLDFSSSQALARMASLDGDPAPSARRDSAPKAWPPALAQKEISIQHKTSIKGVASRLSFEARLN